MIHRLCRPHMTRLIGHCWATAVVLLLDGVFLLWLRLPSLATPLSTPEVSN
uniref:Uncharacterized protein n=1 Tax=Triticum urartu TaxID=4572 RepID=A0A8R7U3G8_TRIUA